MIETRRLKNVVIFIQTILNFVKYSLNKTLSKINVKKQELRDFA